jgi:hypothetical protein
MQQQFGHADDTGDNTGNGSVKKPHPGDQINAWYDKRNEKAREIAIYLAENKIWSEMLKNCLDFSGAMRYDKCEFLKDITMERQAYYNSNFNPAMRPKLTPGLAKEYEFQGHKVYE